jgi:hypothetical protein
MSLILSGTDGLSDVDGSAATPAIRGTDANTGIFFPAADTVGVSTGGSERVRVDSSGNVGIGTSSPGAPLTFGQSVSNKITLYQGTNWHIGMANYSSINVMEFAADASGEDITFGYGAAGSITRNVTFKGTGNVGIGTTSPGRKLSLKGSDVWQKFEETAGSGRSWLIGTGSGTNFRIYDETAALDRMAVDTSGNLQFNSGYGSVATGYGCRAWVNFNGTGTVAIRGSGNVSSITDNGTGDYTVNFTTAMTDASYSISNAAQRDVDNGACITGISVTTSPTTSAVRVVSKGDSNVLVDVAYYCVSIFR